MQISATGLIILITFITSIYTWENRNIFEKWLMSPFYIKKNKEYYRFITSGLVHSDYMHLIFNMLTLWFLGRIVEPIFGEVLFIILYVSGIVISDIPTYFKHKDNYAYRAVGASGGVSSVVFAAILFYPLVPLCLYFLICLPAFVLGLLYLFYSAYMARNSNDRFNHDAHLWGAIYGIVFSIVYAPSVIQHFITQIVNWKGFF